VGNSLNRREKSRYEKNIARYRGGLFVSGVEGAENRRVLTERGRGSSERSIS